MFLFLHYDIINFNMQIYRCLVERIGEWLSAWGNDDLHINTAR